MNSVGDGVDRCDRFISSDHLAYHKRVIDEVERVMQLRSHWFQFLIEHYGLASDEAIAANGRIAYVGSFSSNVHANAHSERS